MPVVAAHSWRPRSASAQCCGSCSCGDDDDGDDYDLT